MPHRRKPINGAPNVKVPKSRSFVRVKDATSDVAISSTNFVKVPESIVRVSSCPDATSDASSTIVQVPESFVRASSQDATSNVAISSINFVNVPGAVHGDLDSSFVAPDMNPFFDVIDDLEAALCSIAFRTAIDFSVFAPGSCDFPLSLPSTPSTHLLPMCPCLVLDTVCSPEVSLDCRHVHSVLAEFIACYYSYEVAFLDDLEYVQIDFAETDWAPEFILSSLLEYESIFEHFAQSYSPRMIEMFLV